MEAHLVVFKLHNEVYGIDIHRVRSIIPAQTITFVPGVPHFIEGLINLRGALVPVIDLRARLDIELDANASKRVIVIVEFGDQQVGIIVDRVTEVCKIPDEAIEPPAPLLSAVDTTYLAGIAKVDERIILLLNLDRIFVPNGHVALRQVA